jgi:hypothetical protein
MPKSAAALTTSASDGSSAGGSTPPPPNVVPPEDLNAAIHLLPSSQLPFGAVCAIDRRIQAVFYHYGVSAAVVSRLDKEEFRGMTEIRLATPGLDEGMWKMVESWATSGVQKFKLKLAIQRLLNDDPMAPVSVKRSASPSPSRSSKKVKVSSGVKVKEVSAVSDNMLVQYEEISTEESDYGDTDEKVDDEPVRKGSNACLSQSLSAISSPVSLSSSSSSFLCFYFIHLIPSCFSS